ncbi:GNAT family N-acetyltransferase [Pseudoalteromonas sp. SMS1]|uniref:GNAT family N-acetyltransferase n=1 Tax=Pseudoalteromonas sp. SMS1 TaxID=2908894 RepID=UPI001F392750|nr:GNAT family N-acetyltransferase [Pseudoalteromonas sp. SMS1]MCF2859045.1 GNAT family N-acetyltransferase [Pseudoalteromonas sp. SMS1]
MMKISASSRLTYRLLTAQDRDLLFALDQDPEVMRYINGGKPNTLADIDDIFVPRLEQFTNTQKGWGLWGCFLAPQKIFIGWILVRPMHFFTINRADNNLEIGWRFMQSHWGQGFASEAAQQVCTALIENQACTTLTAIALPDNLGSIKIMEKIGLVYKETKQHQDPLGDAEVVVYQKQL